MKGGAVIGRLFQVSPKNPELYALRLLLSHVSGQNLLANVPAKGSTTFWTQLKTVDNEECATFQEAARLQGLMKNDHDPEFISEEMLGGECPTTEGCDVTRCS